MAKKVPSKQRKRKRALTWLGHEDYERREAREAQAKPEAGLSWQDKAKLREERRAH